MSSYQYSIYSDSYQNGPHDYIQAPSMQIPPPAYSGGQYGADKGGYINQQPTLQPDRIMAPINACNPANKPYAIDGKREWTYPLCGCCDVLDTCCVSFWCPCLIYSENKSRMRALQFTGQPHPKGGNLLSRDCFIYGLMSWGFGGGWIFNCILRGEERDRARIAGNCCTDCLVSVFCASCGQVQVNRELVAEEKCFMVQPID